MPERISSSGEADRPRRDDDRSGAECLGGAVAPYLDLDDAVALDPQPFDRRACEEREPAADLRREIGIGDADAPAIANGQRIRRRAGERSDIVVTERRGADRPPRLHEVPHQRVHLVRRQKDGERPVAAVHGGGAAGKALAAAERRQQRLVGPAVAARLGPGREIVGMAAHMRHGVDGARSADEPAARPGVDAAVRAGLRRRAIVPVVASAAEQRPFQRIGDVGIGRLAAGLDERDGERRVLGEPRGDDGAGGAGADDDDVEAGQRGHRLAPNAGQAAPVPGARRVKICRCTAAR